MAPHHSVGIFSVVHYCRLGNVPSAKPCCSALLNLPAVALGWFVSCSFSFCFPLLDVFFPNPSTGWHLQITYCSFQHLGAERGTAHSLTRWRDVHRSEHQTMLLGNPFIPCSGISMSVRLSAETRERCGRCRGFLHRTSLLHCSCSSSSRPHLGLSEPSCAGPLQPTSHVARLIFSMIMVPHQQLNSGGTHC